MIGLANTGGEYTIETRGGGSSKGSEEVDIRGRKESETGTEGEEEWTIEIETSVGEDIVEKE